VTLPDNSKSTQAAIVSVFLLSLCFFAAGCATGTPSTENSSIPQLRGIVHGGSQPISGAAIQLYAAGTTGYGTGAAALLNTTVTTDASGSFSITGDYSCPSSTSQLYIVATGGNPGLTPPDTNNAASVLMTALGPCTLYGSQYTLNPHSFIFINEATTVASVYALAPFMTPGTTQVGASSTNSLGLSNAFLSVPNLVNTTTGTPLATTPAGNGTVPQAELNTLADILSSCVNSTGATSTCASLFAAATPTGGTAPTNTLQSIYNIATNPASQVATLYALAPATAPFQPTLSAAPNDWTVFLAYKAYPANGGLQTAIAIDASGDIWIANEDVGPGPVYSSATELSSNGTVLSGSTGYTGGGLSNPNSVAIDASGNAWLTNSLTPGLAKLGNTGTPLSGSTGFALTTTTPGLAVDGFGNVWCGSLAEFDNSGNKLSGSGYTGGGLGEVKGISIDTSENVWIANITGSATSSVSKFTNAGAPLSGTTGYTATGLTGAWSIANDNAGNAWVANNGFTPSVFKFANDGTNLSGSTGYTGGGVSNPLGVAIDGAGNAWVTRDTSALVNGALVFSSGVVELDNNGTILSGANGFSFAYGAYPVGDAVDGSGNVWLVMSDSQIMELIGAATPVVTPLSLGVKNNTLGTRP